MQQIKQKKKKKIEERPIDPSRNYEDMIGDSYGLTGVTTGSAEQTSAEPTDKGKDVDTGNLPGGIIEGKQTNPNGIPRTAVSGKEYRKSLVQGMSPTAAQSASDTASENEQTNANESNNQDNERQEKVPRPGSEYHAQRKSLSPQEQKPIPPSREGEESISGDMPDDESDDDTLENAHDTGEQTEEDPEHPEELDISRDIDESEEHIRTH